MRQDRPPILDDEMVGKSCATACHEGEAGRKLSAWVRPGTAQRAGGTLCAPQPRANMGLAWSSRRMRCGAGHNDAPRLRGRGSCLFLSTSSGYWPNSRSLWFGRTRSLPSGSARSRCTAMPVATASGPPRRSSSGVVVLVAFFAKTPVVGLHRGRHHVRLGCGLRAQSAPDGPGGLARPDQTERRRTVEGGRRVEWLRRCRHRGPRLVPHPVPPARELTPLRAFPHSRPASAHGALPQ